MMTEAQRTDLDRAFSQVRTGFVVVGVFSFFINLLMLVSPLYMMQVFDRVLSSGSTDTLLLLTAIVAFALLILGGLEMARGRLLARIGAWIEERVAGSVLRASLDKRLAGVPIGAEVLRDLGQIRSFFGGQGIQPMFDAPWTPIFVAVIWLLHPWLGMLALASAVVLFALAVINELITRKPLKAASQITSRAQTDADTAIRNADVIQAMGLHNQLIQRWYDTNEKAFERQHVASNRGTAITGASRFIRLFVQSAILGLGAYLAIQGQLTAGGMIAASILLGRALAPVEQSISAWKQFIAARGSLARVRKLLGGGAEPRHRIRLPPPRGHLVVDKVTLLPPGARGGEAKPLLKQVGFEVAPGNALCIIGPSGAGKTSLCRVIAGIWQPNAGCVRLDSADIHDWDRQDLGPHVGFLPQDVELFSASVRDNIARMTPANDDVDRKVIEAAQIAGAHDMILHLPDGYDTPMGENGAAVSAGQRQRIGLARALYDEPKLLVLDEPNANLDQEGELALLSALETMKQKGTTIVTVSHRQGLLKLADKILVLREGAQELFGDREEVLARLGKAKAVTAARRADPAADPAAGPAAPPVHQAAE
jgi:ATP-binding cassette subfamily C protein/ATP-binding cassette subfamily C exporter for protease/lipase/ATP-binding cassette subfamily C protein EexD